MEEYRRIKLNYSNYFVQKKKLSIKIQSLAVLGSVAACVILPQIFHLIGKISGSGTAAGIVFSPMHIPVIVTGLLAGPFAGAATGLFAPLVSYLISGMPVAAMLPFMTAELFGYGLAAGFLRCVKIPAAVKVLVSMIAGRVLYMVAAIVAVFLFKNESVSVLGIWMAVPKCLPGIVLQLAFIPPFVYWVDSLSKKQN